jgi:Lipocalin-like domain
MGSLPSRAMASAADEIVGTYLVQLVEKYRDDGAAERPFGERATGMLLYGPDGAMAAIVGRSDQPALDMDLLAGTVAASDRQLAGAFRSAYGFAGTFEVEGETVRHHILVSTVPNWVGTDQVRPYTIEGEMLTLRPPGWRVVARRAHLYPPEASRP